MESATQTSPGRGEETWQGLGGMAVRESLRDKPSALVLATAGGPLRLEASLGPFWAGYQLCDNSVGVLFNDSTRLIMYNDGDNLQYIEQNNTESYFTVRSYPSALNKKVSPGDRSPGWVGGDSCQPKALMAGGFQGETFDWEVTGSEGFL